jgi:ABC-type antimicrobial peptide transport system permease subunit
VGRADRLEAQPILGTQQTAFPGYLGVMGTPLLHGRDFTADDIANQREVTIIDEGFARRLWPEATSGAVIGQRIAIHRTGWNQLLEVVGVTATVRSTQVRDDSIPHFMIPYSLYATDVSLVVKTRQSTGQMAPWIRSAADEAHTGRAAFDVRSMNDYVADSIGDTRFIMFVLAAFAGASVLLAAVGLYGTLAYLTAQRTREFGIRLALGSGTSAIVAIVFRESVLLAAAGVAAGLIGVAVVARQIQGLLYGVPSGDGVTLAGVVALVAIVTLVAAVVPAWRATRIDPQTALRSD